MNSSDSPHQDACDSTWRSRLVVRTVVFLCYLAGVIAITWPLATSPGSRLPLGTESAETVPLFNVWTIWWNCFQLSEGFSSYWTAPIFAPTEGTFTFSEMQPTTLVVAPVWFASRNLALAYNSYLILSLLLNAIFGYWFCRRAGISRPAAFAGGAFVLCLPYVHHQLGVLQLVPLWPSLWLLGELTAFANPDRTASRWRIGLAFATVYLACHHYGLFLALLLVLCTFILIPLRQIRTPRFWLTLFSNGLLAGLLLAPFVWAQLHYLKEVDSVRDVELVTRLSAKWTDYTRTRSGSWFASLHWVEANRISYWPLSAGLFVWGLGAIGLIGGLFEKQRRRIVLFLGMLLVTGFILSLGTYFHPGGFSLYERVIVHIPGFSQIRNIFRFAVFVQLAAALLAAVGLNLLVRLGTAFRRRPYWSGLVVLVLTGCAIGETWPKSQRFAGFPDIQIHDKWIQWLKDHSEAGEIVANVPFSRGGAAENYLITMRGVILGTEHHRRLVNGYSGFFPQSYIDLRRIADDFPAPAAIEVIHRSGAKYIIDLRRSELAPDDLEWKLLSTEGLEPVYYDSRSQVVIYRFSADTEASD